MRTVGDKTVAFIGASGDLIQQTILAKYILLNTTKTKIGHWAQIMYTGPMI